MNTRYVMIGSALVLGALGLFATFLPQELLQRHGLPSSDGAVLGVQLAGAVYLGFAILNWMAKGVVIGGVYARPLALGNFLHFGAGAVTLAKAGLRANTSHFFWIALAVYGVFAVLFGLLLFRQPSQPDAEKV